ncbi:hypothetical protein SLOPH_922 [Spraguea lophii 42_110]|uniref:Uncharacterized protein n=1 Tax=Spraguea lophii (strain 42_110) TaxID=1358809 RepID=S7W866_SPRLO|nr:hypothetical protein SLOPH_922 [Spraguea lophii 42_110]
MKKVPKSNFSRCFFNILTFCPVDMLNFKSSWFNLYLLTTCFALYEAGNISLVASKNEVFKGIHIWPFIVKMASWYILCPLQGYLYAFVMWKTSHKKPIAYSAVVLCPNFYMLMFQITPAIVVDYTKRSLFVMVTTIFSMLYFIYIVNCLFFNFTRHAKISITRSILLILVIILIEGSWIVASEIIIYRAFDIDYKEFYDFLLFWKR